MRLASFTAIATALQEAGARREQMRRWAALPLERMVAALEEMDQLGIWAGSRREDDGAG
jgi:hypothetical protein